MQKTKRAKGRNLGREMRMMDKVKLNYELSPQDLHSSIAIGV